MTSVAEKLTALRQLMQQHQLDYYYVPSTDEHNNEYVPKCWQRRAWISGFTGSAGDALVGTDSAYLWTDPRYFLQAEQQLSGSEFQLMKQMQGMAPIHRWLVEQNNGKRIGIDPKLFSISQTTTWQDTLDRIGAELVALETNLIDEIWHDQPTDNTHPIRLQAIEYAGEDTGSKLSRLREIMQAQAVDHHVITMLDAIAWLFNFRGQDVAYNPLAISYAIVSHDSAAIFLDVSKLTEQQQDYFQQQGIECEPYQNIAQALTRLRGDVLLDPKTTSLWILHQLDDDTEVVIKQSPISLMKAIKNPTEQAGMHEAHRRDAIAEVKFLHWLDNNWQGQTEISAQTQLEQFRREDPHCHDLSFASISGFGDHGAIIHYSATPATDQEITDKNLYLIDSGGQYFEGTTDITRTIHLGQPTAQQKRHYTLVLKGHLALRHAIFPAGTTGEQLDALAHQFLWKDGVDYGHGTGHGVGCNLCVHEGPQRISRATSGVALEPGMVVSNEPGIYITGEYGIRIENLCVVVKKIASADSLTGHGPFYGFDDLTKVPYARNLIDLDLLTKEEIQAIDQYHADIYALLSNDVTEPVRNWLHVATDRLTETS